MWYRKRAFFQVILSLSLLLTFLLLIGGILEGAMVEEAPSKALLDFREALSGWFRVILVLYFILVLLLTLGYFLLTAVVREEESALLKNLGMSKGEIDLLFSLEALIISSLAVIISAAAGGALLPVLSPLLLPQGAEGVGVFSPELFLKLFIVTLLSSIFGAFVGGEISQREWEVHA